MNFVKIKSVEEQWKKSFIIKLNEISVHMNHKANNNLIDVQDLSDSRED